MISSNLELIRLTDPAVADAMEKELFASATISS